MMNRICISWFIAIFLSVLAIVACGISLEFPPQCCDVREDMNQLKSCTLTTSVTSDFKDICLVTYATSEIDNYSIFSIAVNRYYAFIHRYPFYVVNSTWLVDFDSFDSRWNKVMVALYMLDNHSYECSYVMWLDADLIVMNMEFEIEALLSSNSSNDINMWISRDVDIRNGICNSGSFIFKNSEWSVLFLRKWWSLFDRSSGMDQHALDMLFRDNFMDVYSHSVLFAPEIMNSIIPAWRYQSVDHSFLHLAGSSNRARQRVFERAFEVICTSVVEKKNGTKNINLFELGIDLNYLEFIHFHVIDSTHLQTWNIYDCNFQQIDQVVANVRDLLQNVNLSLDNKTSIKTTLEFCLALYENCSGSLENNDNVSYYLSISLLQRMIDVAFNIAVIGDSDQPRILSKIQLYVDKLQQHLNGAQIPSHESQIWYYYFKIQEFWALYYSTLSGETSLILSLNHYLEAYDVGIKMIEVKSFGTGNAISDPFKEIISIVIRISQISRVVGLYGADVSQCINNAIGYLLEIWQNRIEDNLRYCLIGSTGWLPHMEIPEYVFQSYLILLWYRYDISRINEDYAAFWNIFNQLRCKLSRDTIAIFSSELYHPENRLDNNNSISRKAIRRRKKR